MVNGGDSDRPSSLRRQKLRDGDAIPTVSSLFPLERYYDASEKVLASFEVAFEKKRLDEAYVYGMRYCTFCVKGIAKHDYYRASKFDKLRNLTNDRVTKVLTKLEQVADWMDEEERKREEQYKEILRRQKEERLRKQQQKLDELQKRVNKQKEGQQNQTESVQESAFAKLQRLNGPLDPPPALAPQPIHPPETSTNKRISFEPDGLHLDASSLPPPLLPPSVDGGQGSDENAPPSYQDIVNYFGPSSGDESGQKAPLQEPAVPSYDQVVQKPRQPKRKLSIRQYIAMAERMYVKFQQERKIIVSALNTYQGRVNGSTNGCTVISACVVSKHLQTHGGVTDAHISNIVDRDCIPLLRTIRNKLGLSGSSLIIPSDVHDHMVDHKLLYQHKFVEAVGGNIVDPEHLGQLYDLLRGVPGKTQHLKAAATLFFREHVISIVKFPTSPTEAIYDMVDSMPTCNGRASRTRCMSLEALKVQLEWYSSHKFSDSNCTYIERNRWNDSMADFDPRVFQAFIWADKPKSNE